MNQPLSHRIRERAYEIWSAKAVRTDRPSNTGSQPSANYLKALKGPLRHNQPR
jgi:hypothetical protein